MARFLVLWRTNPAAISLTPVDPSERLKMLEMEYAAIEDLMKKGQIEEFSFFADTNEGGPYGYGIAKGDITEVARIAWMFAPHCLMEIHEIISYDKGKEIRMELMKAMAEAARK